MLQRRRARRRRRDWPDWLNAIATACFWLRTIGPFFEPEWSVPAFHSSMTVFTFAFLPAFVVGFLAATQVDLFFVEADSTGCGPVPNHSVAGFECGMSFAIACAVGPGFGSMPGPGSLRIRPSAAPSAEPAGVAGRRLFLIVSPYASRVTPITAIGVRVSS